MTGLLEGPEHRNDRVAEEVSGVFSASPLSPMTQPADDGRTSRRSNHVRLGRPRQPREATRCRVSPHLLVPTDLAHARSPIAHWAAQNPLRTGRSANGSPVSTPRSKGWLQKTTKLLSENVNSKPPAKRNIRCNTTRRSRRPTTGPRQTSLAPSAIRAKNPLNTTRTCNKLVAGGSVDTGSW